MLNYVRLVSKVLQPPERAKRIVVDSSGEPEPIGAPEDSQISIALDELDVMPLQAVKSPRHGELDEAGTRSSVMRGIVLPKTIVVVNSEVRCVFAYDIGRHSGHGPFIEGIPKDGEECVPEVLRDLYTGKHVCGLKLVYPVLVGTPQGDVGPDLGEDLRDIQWVHLGHDGGGGYLMVRGMWRRREGVRRG
jgi:hypothetical protein